MPQHTKNLLADKKSMLFRVAFYGYTALMLLATLIPLNFFRGNGSGWLSFLAFAHSDKLIHFLMFFIMTGLLTFSYRFINKFWYFAIPFTTGIAIEILQHLTASGRTFDPLDILANTTGAFIAFLLLTKFQNSNT